MADTTLPALLSTGDHASRPAASAVGTGALYSCTDHALVYQTDGSSWTTWASLGGGGIPETLIDAAGDLIVGSAADTAARLAIGANATVLTSNGTTATWAAPAGGGGVTVQDEGTPLSTTATTLDFVGAGVTATGSGATKTITIPGGSSAFAGCRVYNSGNVSLSSGTETTITYDSERYDTDAFHSTSSNTGRLTVPTGLGGYYHIGASVSITASSGQPTYVRIRLNGTTAITVATVFDNGVFEGANVSCDYALADGDYVEFQVYVQNGSKNAIAVANYSPEFWLHKIN